MPVKKTGPKPKFNESDLVRIALKRGVDKFTLADIARELGVSSPSLYRLVQTRNDIVHLCLEHGLSQLTLPKDEMGWQDALRFLVKQLWDLFERYPGFEKAMLETPAAHVHALDYYRDISGYLVAKGFPVDYANVDFLITMLGELTVTGHIAHSTLQRVHEGGETGLNEARERISGISDQAFSPLESWMDAGKLGQYVERIIQAVEDQIELERLRAQLS
ncbi:TetR/AcrR family transcriptional regulator [Corynebacterium sp. ES2794-CONJ1]|uniref:TetR/AcrR family transcriptional regulator n=1 Tax=unclassified Corynebacterium TaxID=2624378 RepID=UPI002168CA9A|nr:MULTISPECIES: TetR/AcrR family transcriptional regulator [unclassified Corynebacterium]MCS4491653.1 TetR/AcrR family transcriptional regulator [Corynebacterium sp. ES2715-CONJ3]MCS4531758.1 TetR/AcrR family transcriptional regulator [Corynebacterium sp. ES2730-CONJ]MCU9519154.1 TetR/AcrR family transcriptional regulator [Corynebacterium sp. ES2794-CONJ1]